MSQVIDTIMGNSLFLIITIVIVVVIAFSLLKKLFKIAGIILLVAVIWVGYIYLNYDEPENEIQKIIKKSTEAAETAKEKALDLKEDIQKEIDKNK